STVSDETRQRVGGGGRVVDAELDLQILDALYQRHYIHRDGAAHRGELEALQRRNRAAGIVGRSGARGRAARGQAARRNEVDVDVILADLRRGHTILLEQVSRGPVGFLRGPDAATRAAELDLGRRYVGLHVDFLIDRHARRRERHGVGPADHQDI